VSLDPETVVSPFDTSESVSLFLSNVNREHQRDFADRLRAICGSPDRPATLTFHPRRARLEATAAGLTLQAPIHQEHTRVTACGHTGGRCTRMPGLAIGRSAAHAHRASSESRRRYDALLPARHMSRCCRTCWLFPIDDIALPWPLRDGV